MKESIQEFLARGGQVRRVEPGSEAQTSTNSEVMRKDAELQALRALRSQLRGANATEAQLALVEEAITRRIALLR